MPIGEQLQTRVLPETIERINELAKETNRGKGDVVDWAVKTVYIAWQHGITLDYLPGAQSVPVVTAPFTDKEKPE